MTPGRIHAGSRILFCPGGAPRAAHTLEIHPVVGGKPVYLPLASLPARAGFSSPAGDCLETAIDLNSRLIRNPAATFRGSESLETERERGNRLMQALDKANRRYGADSLHYAG